jgi:hypothetical protein
MNYPEFPDGFLLFFFDFFGAFAPGLRAIISNR